MTEDARPVQDRRIARSRRALRSALFTLMEARGYDALTVADITDRADVSRGTFYAHYQDKEDLLTDALEDLIHGLATQVHPLGATDLASGVDQTSVLFLDAGRRRQLYTALLGSQGPAIAVVRVRRHLAAVMEANTTRQLVESSGSTLPAGFLASHAAGALLGQLIWWLEHDCPIPSAEMGPLFARLTTPGVLQVLGLPGAGTDVIEADSSPPGRTAG